MIDAYNVREYWVAGVTWFEWEFIRNIRFAGAYGYSNTEFKKLARTQSTVTTLGDIVAGQDATQEDSNVDAQNNHRWQAGLVHGRDGWEVGVTGEWIDNDFEAPTRTSANIGLVALHGTYNDKNWNTTAALSFIDQRYDATPDDYHMYTSNRNRWLDYADDLTLTHLAMFDLASASEVALAFDWDGVDSTAAWGGLLVHSTLDVATQDLLKSMDYAALRIAGEYRLPRQFYVQVDGRLARYDKSLWGVRESFVSSYVEFGFRNHIMEISLGAGIDPVVLNPVTNIYQDIGREEFIRRAIPAVADAFAGRGAGCSGRATGEKTRGCLPN